MERGGMADCSVGENMRGIFKNAKGQIAIFVVLVFQVLFILFAMTINIGLVVHDKINFQNSLDLAVYYGAKKQAEVLNAMAHINYQMRQNWKLLAWRYRILGTLGQDHGHPQTEGPKNYWCPQNEISSGGSNSQNNYCDGRGGTPNHQSFCNAAMGRSSSLSPRIYDGYCDAKYFICISNKLWQRGIRNASTQNICEKYEVHIQPITPLNIVAPFMAEAQIAFRGVQNLMPLAAGNCRMESVLNWFMAQMFLTHFRLDQKDRKVMMANIYDKTLKEGKDLDGEDIFKGAKNVFSKNLSSANKKGAGPDPYGLVEFNSFGDEEFKIIFEYLNVWPILHYLKTDGSDYSSSSGCKDAKIRPHYKYGPDDWRDDVKPALSGHPLEQHINRRVEHLFNQNMGNGYVTEEEPNNPLKGLTMGFLKNENKILYYGLKANIRYKSNIFSLGLTSINFKASAFAKAFGGQFGPQKNESDPFIPLLEGGAYHSSQKKNKAPSPNNLANVNSFILQPNYSRWPGDKWGLIDYNLHANSSRTNFLNKHHSYDKQQVYTYAAFPHLILWDGPVDDPLARPPENPQNPSNAVNPYNFMRMMELMAIYPDLYDLANYSIVGNYHQTYFKKICKLLTGGDCLPNSRKQIPLPGFPAYIRGDFGWPETDNYIAKNLREQGTELSLAPYFLKGNGVLIKANIIDLPPQRGNNRLPPLIGQTSASRNTHALTQGNIFYPWLAQDLPDHLLSSWYPTTNENRYGNYTEADTINPPPALKCFVPALEGKPVPSACAKGGRSGYSVKLISCETVKNFSGDTKKPPNINEWCPN